RAPSPGPSTRSWPTPRGGGRWARRRASGSSPTSAGSASPSRRSPSTATSSRAEPAARPSQPLGHPTLPPRPDRAHRRADLAEGRAAHFLAGEHGAEVALGAVVAGGTEGGGELGERDAAGTVGGPHARV